MDRDLIEVTIPQLHRYYAERKYTVSQVVDWYLVRIARYNGIYRPIEQVFDADARALAAREDAQAATAHGPLWGVPIVIKANTSIAGQGDDQRLGRLRRPGSRAGLAARCDCRRKLRAAGAIILGHTNMPDFANSDTTRSSSFGRTGNAYDVRFSPGGSSGGTVTAVTGNMAVLGNGTDTGNSIRMPSATSALIGVFPTRGLVSIAGIAPLDWLLDNTGPIARTVTDAAIALEVMAGEDPLDPVTRAPPRRRSPVPRAISQARCAQGQALRCAGIHSGGRRHPVSRDSRGGIGRGGGEAGRRASRGARSAYTRRLPEGARGVTLARCNGRDGRSVLPESFAHNAARISTYPYGAKVPTCF